MNMRRFVPIALLALAAGCEGWNRKTPPPTDLKADEKQVAERLKAEGVNMADELEKMSRTRQQYIDQLWRLEKLYLEMGDMARSSWARKQRMDTESVLVYPYATDQAPEQRSEVRPEQTIPEADTLYFEAEKLIKSFRPIPLAGVLEFNKKKARQAIDKLREILVKYPKSDKVDDAAYWIGECYKEYLREEDPDNLLAIRYYLWALELDPRTPHPVRFQAAVVYDYRQHDRARAIEMYHRVIDDNETYHSTNIPYARARIKELTDELKGRDRPWEEREPGGQPALASPAQDEPRGPDTTRP